MLLSSNAFKSLRIFSIFSTQLRFEAKCLVIQKKNLIGKNEVKLRNQHGNFKSSYLGALF